jgi:phosphoglycerate dehydrogenase-like enzyme
MDGCAGCYLCGYLRRREQMMKIRLTFAALLLCWGGAATADTASGDEGSRALAALIDSLGLEASAVPARDWPGWRRPERIVVRVDEPGRLAWLQSVAPGVELVPLPTGFEPEPDLRGADALIGACSEELVSAATDLRWIQVLSAGVEHCVSVPGLLERDIRLTNMQRVAGPVMAEHVFALLLGLTRNVGHWIDAQRAAQWRRTEGGRDRMVSLRGKTLLVVGLGGIGTEVARLGHAFGMEVIATRASARQGPTYVSYVGLPHELNTLARRADVVVSTVPLTGQTRGIFDADFFGALPAGALFINVGRGGSVDTAALLDALENGQLAGAGLDVTDPEPLPADHPLWRREDVIITPHVSAGSDAGREDRWLIARENLRRYVAGEALLSVVDLERGY